MGSLNESKLDPEVFFFFFFSILNEQAELNQ